MREAKSSSEPSGTITPAGPPEGSAKDAVIFAVMGTTGSGKSTFIQRATGRQDIPIGHQLRSCTAQPFLYEFSFDGRPAALLDTPGFDDTYKTDAEVLQGVADVLATTYKNNMKLSGIVYLQRITDPRLTHGGRANLAMFRALCGDNPLRKVVLATTFWGEINNMDRAKDHEEELRTTPEYWGSMLSNKATMSRFHDTQESALNILRGLLQDEERVSLKIQQEMVDQDLDLARTTAGETLDKELSAMAERYARDLEDHRRQMDKALKARDIELEEIKADQVRRTEDLLQKMQNQREVLNARRRDDIRDRDMQFEARLRKMLHEQETEALERHEAEMQALDKAAAEAKESQADHEKLLVEKDKARVRRDKILDVMGALGTTATAAGLSVINPLAIPVAFGGLINLINACFSRRDAGIQSEKPAAINNIAAA